MASPNTLPVPAVILCSWCSQYGSHHIAARLPDTPTWASVTCAVALALETQGIASHGVCPACLRRVVREWEHGPTPAGATDDLLAPAARPAAAASRCGSGSRDSIQ